MSDLKHTQRGFAYIEFQDRYEHKCSLQKSSLATEDAIWFGIDDANPQVLHGDARRLGIETDATSGWVPYPLPAEVSLATRMHLTQDQVRELLPTLIHFAETGDVMAPADCRTQPEATAPAQDLSLAIYEAIKHGDEGHRDWLKAALQAFFAGQPMPEYVASSANALSAGDRVDAERWRFRQKFLLDGGAVLWSQRGCQYRNAHGVIMCQGATEEEAIDAAILQSQKGGQNG